MISSSLFAPNVANKCAETMDMIYEKHLAQIGEKICY